MLLLVIYATFSKVNHLKFLYHLHLFHTNQMDPNRESHIYKKQRFLCTLGCKEF